MSRRQELLDALQERLGHRFSDPDLLDRALTHSSYSNEHDGARHNERLEFLGDAVLDGIIAHMLFTRFPRATEGMLSHQKHQLVQERTLADIGRDLGLGRVLRVGTGARRSGVQHQAAKLEDATEALVAAIFLDAGHTRAVEVVTPWFDRLLTRLVEERPKGAEVYKNAISRLHELVQRPPLRTRAHEVVLEQLGSAHEPVFRMGWWVGGEILAEGTGPKKKVALRAAASPAIARLEGLLREGWRPDPEATPPGDESEE